jgi:hypothetical protein
LLTIDDEHRLGNRRVSGHGRTVAAQFGPPAAQRKQMT